MARRKGQRVRSLLGSHRRVNWGGSGQSGFSHWITAAQLAFWDRPANSCVLLSRPSSRLSDALKGQDHYAFRR